MTPQQLENSKFLLKIIKEKIDRNEPRELLDQWIQPCGTKGCVLGDYVIQSVKQKRNVTFMEPPSDNQQRIATGIKREGLIFIGAAIHNLHGEFEEHFGFNRFFKIPKKVGDTSSKSLEGNVIGWRGTGSLEARYKYVSDIIDHQERVG